MSTDADPVLVATRRALHGVAELVLAGPQYAGAGTIKLRVVADGIATVSSDVKVTRSGTVVGPLGAAAIDGSTPARLATQVGLVVRPLDDLYRDGPGVGPDDVLVADAGSIRTLLDALAVGDGALRALAPEVEPVLWPEHFDVGISLDEVNYGLSPGDGLIPEPYAYVGPWTPPEQDEFWDQPFGAARKVAGLGPDQVLEFWEEGRARAAR